MNFEWVVNMEKQRPVILGCVQDNTDLPVCVSGERRKEDLCG